MTVDEFLDMTPREFSNAIDGYVKETEQRSREAWEQARLIAYYAVAPHVKGGKPMHRMIPLPWDKEGRESTGTGEKPSREEVQRLMHRLNKTVPGWQDRPLVIS